MEIWSFWLDKMGILPSYSHVGSTVQLHHMDFSKMLEEKARWELHKDDACYSEQILETAPNKTAERPLTSHLTGHSWRNKDKLINNILQLTTKHGLISAGRLAKTHISCVDTGCCVEDLPRVMSDRNRLQERVKEICAISITWECEYMKIYLT